MNWSLLLEHRVEIARQDLRDYAREQLGTGLRRAGMGAEFTLASALACWRRLEPPVASPCLALIWTCLTLTTSENAECLRELLEAGSLPMPFQFIASQPHMAAVHAERFLPGLAHAATLLHSGAEVEERLLPALALRRPWTHVLLGEVWTPHAWGEEGEPFRAVWRILERRESPEKKV